MNRPLLASALLLATTSIALATPPDEIHWTVMGQTAVTFDWRGTDDQISFGISQGSYTSTVTAATPSPLPDGAGPFWEARLTGLTENTLYYYRIGTGSERTFRTPLPRGASDYWFAELADVGSTLTYPQVGPTQDSLATDEANVPGNDTPRFALVVGDLTYGDQDGVTRIDQHFNDVMSWSERTAYMPAWGNHEWDPAGSVRLDQVNNYKGRFDLPNPQLSPGTGTTCIQNDTVTGEDWYWFDYGNVRFISYPPGSEGTCGYSGARAAWKTTAGTIMAAVDNDPQIHLIVTYGHFPPYSSGTDFTGDAARQADMAALHAAHPKYVLNFSGHSHHYERFDPTQTGGVQQIIGPGGGSTLANLGTALASTVVRYKHLEHLKLHVTKYRIEGYCICGPSRPEEGYVCTPGTIIDSWSVVSPVPDLTPPVAALTSPTGGESWLAGTGHAITWAASDDGEVSGVDLALSTDGGATYPTVIAAGLVNTGAFAWTVPASFTAHARVRVTAHDGGGNTASDASPADFAVGGSVGVANGDPRFALSPVLPDPVRAATHFEFELPEAMPLHLGVYDVQGRERGVVADGTYPAGRRGVDWNVSSQGGLTPGLYFLRLTAPGHMLARRFMVVR